MCSAYILTESPTFSDLCRKVVGTIEKVEQAGRKVQQLEHLGGALLTGKKVNRAITNVKQADRKLGGAIGQVKKVIKSAKQITSGGAAHHTAHRRHHRRDLEDDEELSRRDLDAEELYEREYAGIMVERDFFDDLD